MQATAKTQRRRVERQPSDPSVIRIEMKDGLGNLRWATADLLDLSDGGFSLGLRTSLKPGSTVVVRGKLGHKQISESLKVGVRWCKEIADGTFRAGLEYLDARATFAAEPEAENLPHPDAQDLYEVMQLSPNADAETISRVFRILAHRYHPDNAETGNVEMFMRITEAHEVLSDLQKRASYDVHHRETKKLHWKIFDQVAASMGREGEKRKRQGILALLYAKMLNDPEHAELNIQSMEDLLGCPREHLEAALWYLRGKNFIRRGDNGRFSITVAGFEAAESDHFAPSHASRQLEAPAN